MAKHLVCPHQIYWRLGGPLKEDRQNAHAQFLEAARLHPSLAGAFTSLGRYYLEVQSDELRARRCFQKAVQLDPDDEHAGKAPAGCGRPPLNYPRCLQSYLVVICRVLLRVHLIC